MSLLFPADPKLVNYAAWLGIAALMIIWVCIIRHFYGDKVLPVTSGQEMGQEIDELDLINSMRASKGKEPLDRAAFKKAFDEELSRLITRGGRD